MSTVHSDITGIWRSCYWYPNTKHDNREDTSKYTVQVERMGNDFVYHSFKNEDEAVGSYLEGRMSQDNSVITASFREDTSREGDWEGMGYKGAVQLILSEDGATMEGLWVAVGYNNGTPKIFNGRWQLKRVDEETERRLTELDA